MGLPIPLRDLNRQHPCGKPPQVCRLSVLGVSHALDGFRRHRPRGFISPHSHVQDLLFRGFPFRTAGSVSSTPPALSSLAQVPCQRLPADARFLCPALRASFRARVRCVRPAALTTTRARSPLELRPPPGSPSLVRKSTFVPFAAHDLAKSPSSRPLGGLRRFRPRARLASLEVAALLEVLDLSPD